MLRTIYNKPNSFTENEYTTLHFVKQKSKIKYRMSLKDPRRICDVCEKYRMWERGFASST